MTSVELVADTNVVSYLFGQSTLGFVRRLKKQLLFLEEFSHVPDTKEMAEVCGGIRAHRRRIGEPIDWPDAWAAACAVWLDVPLVTHDWDHEGIPGLRVLTVHQGWQVREQTVAEFASEALWLGEGRCSTRHGGGYLELH